MSSSRRGAVKINPVTGELIKIDKEESVKHRDGAMMVDEKYINAAKELGLGGADGMYSHIKSLVRVGGADVPHGTSIEREGDDKRRIAAAGAGAEKAKLDAKDTSAVVDAIKTSVSTVGRAKVAGFGASKPTSSIHNHEDAFQRRKGVVNTIGGAKDTTRNTDARLPPKSERTGARVVSMDTIDTLGAEGQRRRENQDKRETAKAKIAAASRNTLHGAAATAKALEGSGIRVSAPVKAVPKASTVTTGDSNSAAHSAADVPRRTTTSTNVLGGSATTKENVDHAAVAARRAAFFEKKFKEDQEKKQSAAV